MVNSQLLLTNKFFSGKDKDTFGPEKLVLKTILFILEYTNLNGINSAHVVFNDIMDKHQIDHVL